MNDNKKYCFIALVGGVIGLFAIFIVAMTFVFFPPIIGIICFILLSWVPVSVVNLMQRVLLNNPSSALDKSVSESMNSQMLQHKYIFIQGAFGFITCVVTGVIYLKITSGEVGLSGMVICMSLGIILAVFIILVLFSIKHLLEKSKGSSKGS